jgi:hypothetical protein
MAEWFLGDTRMVVFEDCKSPFGWRYNRLRSFGLGFLCLRIETCLIYVTPAVESDLRIPMFLELGSNDYEMSSVGEVIVIGFCRLQFSLRRPARYRSFAC